VALEQCAALAMMLVVGIEVRVERPGVQEEGYPAISSRRMASMRSETS
jgi:hypothetical protein